jgi:hypothetical protein
MGEQAVIEAAAVMGLDRHLGLRVLVSEGGIDSLRDHRLILYLLPEAGAPHILTPVGDWSAAEERYQSDTARWFVL